MIAVLDSCVGKVPFVNDIVQTALALSLKPNLTAKKPRMNHELWCLDRKLCLPISIGTSTVSESYLET
jgi:hypothetical protein